MILWTIQPEEVYRNLMETGVYHCNLELSGMKDWKQQYDWLVSQMVKRIGNKPHNVTYPVWAWYKHGEGHKKPDLRKERWSTGWKGEVFYRIEIDIPDRNVLLSDFEVWSIILLNGLVSDTEAESDALEMQYNNLKPSAQKQMKMKNWEKVFDLSEIDNGWIAKGDYIQATFWELRKEQIIKASRFVSATPRAVYSEKWLDTK